MEFLSDQDYCHHIGNGDGYGDGYGYGHGDGDGDGDGHGDGNGYGDGNSNPLTDRHLLLMVAVRGAHVPTEA